MTTYVLEMRSTADWKDVRYREYTTSKRKADLFAQVPKIAFTDSGHGIVPSVREHCGRRQPRNMVLQDHVVDSIKALTKPRLPAKQEAGVKVEELADFLRRAEFKTGCAYAAKARALLARYSITKRTEG
jgi:hypothetical protein